MIHDTRNNSFVSALVAAVALGLLGIVSAQTASAQTAAKRIRGPGPWLTS